MAVGRDASLSSDESDDDLGLSGNVTRSAKSVRVRHGSGQFSTQAELFEAWRKDELFQTFLSEDFDIDTFMSVINLHNVSRLADRLNAAVRTIDAHIHAEVAANHEDLLRQSVQIDAVETDAKDLLNESSALQSEFQAIHASIMQPFEKIKRLVNKLNATQENAEVLRCVLRFVQLVSKAKSALHSNEPGSLAEASRNALILSEIIELANASDLHTIDCLSADYLWVQQQTDAIRAQTESALKAALLCGNQVDIGAALQCAFNLNQLAVIVSNVVDGTRSDFENLVKTMLDVSTLLSPTTSKADSEQTGARLRSLVWQHLESVFDGLLEAVTNISTLQTVLGKKTDSQTRQTLQQIVMNNRHSDAVSPKSRRTLLLEFFQGVVDVLEGELQAFCNRSTLLSGVVESEFPRLFDLSESAWERGLARILPASCRADLFRAIARYQSTFVSKLVAKMQSPLSIMFPSSVTSSSPVPTSADIATMFSAIVDSMAAVEGRQDLHRPILKGAAGTIFLCASKCEELLGHEVDNSPMLWTAPTYDRLASIFTILGSLDHNLMAVIAGIHPRCRSVQRELASTLLGPPRRSLRSIGQRIVQPLFNMTLSSLESAIAPDSAQIVDAVKAELERLRTALLKIASKPFHLKGYLKPFTGNIETFLMLRFAASMSTVMHATKDTLFARVLAELPQLEAAITQFLTCADSKRGTSDPSKRAPVKLAQFRSMIANQASVSWMPPTNDQRMAIPKFALASIALAGNTGTNTICDLICWSSSELFRWLLSHDESEHVRLLREYVLDQITASDSQVFDFVSQLVSDES
ncbi:Conserved oligomeric Golgi complex subunit 5 [Plasmodiophora brassicae]